MPVTEYTLEKSPGAAERQTTGTVCFLTNRYVATVSSLPRRPGDTVSARTVCEDDTVTGPSYSSESAVGVEPSSV